MRCLKSRLTCRRTPPGLSRRRRRAHPALVDDLRTSISWFSPPGCWFRPNGPLNLKCIITCPRQRSMYVQHRSALYLHFDCGRVGTVGAIAPHTLRRSHNSSFCTSFCVLRASARKTQKLVLQLVVAAGDPPAREYCPNGLKIPAIGGYETPSFPSKKISAKTPSFACQICLDRQSAASSTFPASRANRICS